MLQHTAEQVIWTELKDLQEGVKAQIATGMDNTVGEPHGMCGLQRNSVPNDPRKDKHSQSKPGKATKEMLLAV